MKQTITKLVSRLNYYASSHHIWPEVDYELLDFKRRGMLSGKVLNAGAGWRKLDHLVEGELVNQDIKWPEDQRTHIHVFSPIHQIPVQDNTFDMIVCLAVLEHVENPTEIVKEFLRVLKPGGHCIASVPFLQPEHKCPTDFQRYTRDGLVHLFKTNGFEVVESSCLFNVYHTLHWILAEYFGLFKSKPMLFVKWFVLILVGKLAKTSQLKSDIISTAFQVLAKKPPIT
jgi:SAM-dependent methyltransferase